MPQLQEPFQQAAGFAAFSLQWIRWEGFGGQGVKFQEREGCACQKHGM